MTSGRSLLLVDDEEPIRRGFGRLFRQRGVEVTTAATAGEALHLARRTRPHVALVDVVLGDECGISLVEPLRIGVWI